MRSIQFITLTLLLALGLILSACNALGPANPPTPDAAAIQSTLDAAATSALQTIAFQLTGTALAQPTNTATPTLEPTSTNTPTLEPTATNIPPTSTNTPVPFTATPTFTPTPGNFACQVVSVSPAAGSRIKISDDFDMIWTVKNIGLKNWDVGTLDLKYDSGEKLQKYADIFDINSLVETGKEIKLVVDMAMRPTAGTYTATWKLLYNGSTLCTLPISLIAVNP